MKKFLIGLVIALLIVGSLFFLNVNYKWIEFNKEKPIKEVKKDTEEEIKNPKKLVFNNKDYLNSFIELLELKESNYEMSDLTNLNSLNSTLEENCNNLILDLKAKEQVTIDDIKALRKDLIISAEELNIKLAKLSSLDLTKYTTLAKKMTLTNYFYVDQTEGVLMLDVNYPHIYNELMAKLTDEAADYLKLKYNIYTIKKSNGIFKDGGLVLEFSQFKDVILLYDAYAQKYSNEFFDNEYKFNYEVFIGKQYMPNINLKGEGTKILTEYLNEYKDILDNYPNFTHYVDLEEIYNNNQ